MKIVITGGAGFIGQSLATSLLEQGHKVVVIDSLSPQIHGSVPSLNLPLDVDFHRIDVTALVDHYELLEGADIIFHLAAETGTAQSMYRISHYVTVNELGTAALLEAIAKCQSRPKKVILASSRSIYGEGAYRYEACPTEFYQPPSRTREQLSAGNWEIAGPNGEELELVATPEVLLPKPGSIYAATKYSQEMLINSASLALGFNAVILRFQNVYGEGQSLLNPYTGIISIFFNRARQGLDIPIYEDGKESRDFVHITDVVNALMLAINANVKNGSCFNVGSGVPTSVEELATTLLNVSGFNVSTKVTGEFRVGDIRHCYADLSMIKAQLGFSPKIDLHNGLQRFCNWAATQPVFEDKLAKATSELRTKGLAG